MTCPSCATVLSDVLWIGDVIVCPDCGKTWARTTEGEPGHENAILVLATGAHVDQLSADDLKAAKARRATHYRRR